jgi:hypothetical protein
VKISGVFGMILCLQTRTIHYSWFYYPPCDYRFLSPLFYKKIKISSNGYSFSVCSIFSMFQLSLCLPWFHLPEPYLFYKCSHHDSWNWWARPTKTETGQERIYPAVCIKPWGHLASFVIIVVVIVLLYCFLSAVLGRSVW